MTVLVTGSAGHLGEGIVLTLRAAGRPVLGLDAKASAFTDRVGSILERAFLKECLDGVTAVIHAATLHKPHLATHSFQDFVDANVTGTRILLEEAVAADVACFVYTSTTSVFGKALSPGPEQPAVWVTEELGAEPKNVYGLTKLLAEGLCELSHHRHGLPVIVLRTSRFFPEADDDAAVRNRYEPANVQANEMLYRRVDIEDVVTAHLLAIEKAQSLGFARHIISATSPFEPDHVAELRVDAPTVVHRLFPESQALYGARGWKLFPTIGRVYINQLARSDLNWQPKYDFRHVLECLRQKRDFRSALALSIGSKGYHDRTFAEGPYPVN